MYNIEYQNDSYKASVKKQDGSVQSNNKDFTT